MRALLITAVIAWLASPVLADPNPDPTCGPDGNIALGVVQVGNDPNISVFYVDDQNAAFGNGAHLYQETNGWFDASAPPIENLQKGDDSEILPGDADTCGPPSTVLPDWHIL